MAASPIDAQAAGPGSVGAASASGPLLVYADRDGNELVFSLAPGMAQVTVGRGRGQDLVLGWDEQVSRLHARLERVGEDWSVVDDGLSSNGTFVNGARVSDRRRLADGDVLRLGTTTMTFRAGAASARTAPGTVAGGAETAVGEPVPATRGPGTAAAGGARPAIDLSTSQRRVLAALCRPYRDGTIATPASDQQIADELFLQVAVVRKHLSVLFAKLEVEQTSAEQMRARLVERAFETGVIARQDL